ncbi:MAG TPA: DHHA1 domain-containing protein [Bryobacteraceae bacterium]|nr:DHHA1 domain-containing protein [Bryobacteraceae bacterium]
MTDRLYYNDSYLTEFSAQVIGKSSDGLRVYLDRTAFYPTSGGQPFDIGKLGGVEVTEVVDEDGRIAHQLSAPVEAAAVSGVIDWQRRFDHMQQHTGQHLLSAVLVDLFDAQTVSFHLGVDACTIDVARTLEPAQIREAERRANEIVFENRPVTVGFEDSSQDLGLRKPTEREGVIRIISIDNLDRSACGGTHVRATGEIGPILIRKLDRIRGNQRIEFLCGLRAVKRARADFEALSSVARAFSAPHDELPALVAAQLEKLQDSEKVRRRLATELAQAKGRELYAATAPGPDGVRRVVRRVPVLADELRAEAQSFTAGAKAVFLAMGENPPAILLAASADSGMNAGAFLKDALAKAGGRGGGSATMAQGSVPSKDLLDQFVL